MFTLKRSRKIWLMLALISLLLVCAAPTQAENVRETVTSVSVCGPFEGGRFETHGGMTFIRDAPSTCRHTSTDPRANGTTHSIFNANLDASGNGPVWGFDNYVSDEGGIFWCHFNGQISNGIMAGHAEIRGEGLYKGLLGKVTFENGVFTWEITDPGK
jgi:hypothetical protein